MLELHSMERKEKMRIVSKMEKEVIEYDISYFRNGKINPKAGYRK